MDAVKGASDWLTDTWNDSELFNSCMNKGILMADIVGIALQILIFKTETCQPSTKGISEVVERVCWVSVFEFVFDGKTHYSQSLLNKASNAYFITIMDILNTVRFKQIFVCQAFHVSNFKLVGNALDSFAHVKNLVYNTHLIQVKQTRDLRKLN